MSPEPSLPPVATPAEWEEALAALRAKEKAHTRDGDAISAERRRLPMVHIEQSYRLRGPDGSVELLDVFEGRRQLIVYHFMFGPDAEAGCEGCSWVVDAMSHPAHLAARDTTLALVSRAELDELERYRERMGWNLPWYSSFGSDFNEDMGATIDGEEHHGVSVFIRDGAEIYRTYYTGDRGVEHLGSHWTYLDLTPFGRQESWEDSPPGRPQQAPYVATRRHDEY